MLNFVRRVLAVTRRTSGEPRPHWESMLAHAFSAQPALFTRNTFARRYSELSANRDWFADSLVSNACLEGYGARQILQFSRLLQDDRQAAQVQQHALDESRHASVFVHLLNLVFPGLLDAQQADVRQQVAAMQPFLTQTDIDSARNERITDPQASLGSQAALPDLIQIHITEMRALLLQDLLREALLYHAPSGHHERILRMSDQLITDEGRHIAYCADIFEEMACGSTQLADRLHIDMQHYLARFNDMTQQELDQQNIEI